MKLIKSYQTKDAHYSIFALLEQSGQLSALHLFRGPSTKSPNKRSWYAALSPETIIWGASGNSFKYSPKSGISEQKLGLSFLEAELAELEKKDLEESTPELCGFLSYEFLHNFENVTRTSNDPFELPEFLFFKPGVLIEATETELKLFASNHRDKELLNTIETLLVQDSRTTEESEITETSIEDIAKELEPFSNFSEESYIKAVTHIQSEITKGNVYQVNLTQRFSLPYSAKPPAFAAELFDLSQPEFGGFFHCHLPDREEPITIASASPELFLRSDGDVIHCSPIKGTRKRGTTEEQDLALAEELLNSEKDRAELSMIVDLVRNDLGRFAKIGSVKVENHARLETLPNVHHLVSDVSAELGEETSLLEILGSTFPCGSITGTPKIAAMKEISKLERSSRGVYTGSIGFFGPSRTFELNVAIRTATFTRDEVHFQSGGAVVIDSEPEAEYLESLTKASKLYQAYLRACR